VEMLVPYFSLVLYQTWKTPTNIHVYPILNSVKFVCVMSVIVLCFG